MSKNKDNLYIVGLGNPGEKYRRTRHNAGFDFVDLICEKFKSSWTEEKRGKYLISNINLPTGKTLRLIKPMSYMNLSGEPVLSAIKFYKDLELKELERPINLLVVHDELDFKPGILKLKFGGGAGGHKGIQSMIDMLGTKEFYRYRVGIGHPRELEGGSFIDVSDWVLAKSDKESESLINELSQKVADKLCKQLLSENHLEDFRKILANCVLV